jgi:hypothetical protein
MNRDELLGRYKPPFDWSKAMFAIGMILSFCIAVAVVIVVVHFIVKAW